MNASVLTADEVSYVIDCFLASHPWVADRLRAAANDGDAAKIAERELRNSGFSQLVDAGTLCPQCHEIADREPTRSGWYCGNPQCVAFEHKVCELDDRGWYADGLFQGKRGITVREAPRLGKCNALITWNTVASQVRRDLKTAQLAVF